MQGRARQRGLPRADRDVPGAEQMKARPLPDGARSVAWAAALADDGPSGDLFRDGAPLAW